MLDVLLSRLMQLFLVHKLFFRACSFFPSLSPCTHTLYADPLQGVFGCTVPGSMRSPAAHGQDEQLSEQFVSQVSAICLLNKRIWRV